MKVVNKEREAMSVFFDETNQENTHVTMGRVLLLPGEKIPKEGFSSHEEDEFSYVVTGEVHTVLEDGTDILGVPGDAQLIEANEKHQNYNDGTEPAEVIWFLVKRD